MCYIVRSERVYQLSCVGAALLFLGSVLGLIGDTIVQPDQPGVASDLSVAGSAIMLFGGTMWAYCNFIFGPLEYVAVRLDGFLACAVVVGFAVAILKM